VSVRFIKVRASFLCHIAIELLNVIVNMQLVNECFSPERDI